MSRSSPSLVSLLRANARSDRRRGVLSMNPIALAFQHVACSRCRDHVEGRRGSSRSCVSPVVGAFESELPADRGAGADLEKGRTKLGMRAGIV